MAEHSDIRHEQLYAEVEHNLDAHQQEHRCIDGRRYIHSCPVTDLATALEQHSAN